MKLMPLALLGLFIFGFASAAFASDGPGSASTASAARDLRDWTPREDGNVSLDGTWDLYWNRLLTPSEFAAGTQAGAVAVSVPAEWRTYRIDGRPLSNEGYATYRLLLRFGKPQPGSRSACTSTTWRAPIACGSTASRWTGTERSARTPRR
ncbi:hypothetical protein [Cohnella fermenti]|uniref:Beta-galactosidase n=1 Tax=Cohnella fermenti TaxID=2565925 RepID=A0A4S4BRC7_9BACL|nr:hypothetical protein [Cohnella fermenti]THF77517.1 hypothetical protein E6C55_15990 [Cohnella fermenti]